MNSCANYFVKTLTLVLVAIIARVAIAETVQSPVVQPENDPNFEQKIQMIDAEIWLLKAELAQKNGDVLKTKTYLQNLEALFDSTRFPSQFQQRVEQLRHYLSLTAKQPSAHVSISYRFDPRRILALLPMSGSYAQAGLGIYQSMQAEMQQISTEYHLEVLDTNIYDSMQEVWEWVELYKPSFIFGPLQKENILQLATLQIETPILAFNEVDFSNPYVKFLTPHSAESMIKKLISLMGNGVYRRIIVLTDDSSRSQTLYRQLQKAWAENQTLEKIQVAQIFFEQRVMGQVDRAMDKVVHGHQSSIRSNWLQKVLQTPIHSMSRTRDDIDMIISFLPYQLAMQVTPLLSYYQLNQVPHYWVPSKLPASKTFIRSLPFWQATSAIFPAYYTELLNSKSDKDDLSNDQVGIFPALGTSAIKAVTRLSFEQPNVIQTELGILSLDVLGKLHLSPDLVWIDAGSFEIIEK